MPSHSVSHRGEKRTDLQQHHIIRHGVFSMLNERLARQSPRQRCLSASTLKVGNREACGFLAHGIRRLRCDCNANAAAVESS